MDTANIDLRTGTFDGDGFDDVVVAGRNGAVEVFLSNGDGTFATPVSYAVGSGPIHDVVVADFNGDGNLDIAATSSSPFLIGILMGVGDGTFSTVQTYPTAQQPFNLAVEDFNDDGILDLAVTNQSATVSIYLGNGSGGIGDGTFGTPTSFAASSSPRRIETGDFNGDGIVDLISKDSASGLTIQLGNGDGTFPSAIPTLDIGANFYTSKVTGDFNGDGIPDYAISSWRSPAVIRIYSGNGSGGIGDGTVAPAVAFPVGTPRDMALGDFNGDGVLDIAVASGGTTNGVSILLGTSTLGIPDGGFSAATVYPGGGTNPFGVVTADFNGDGILDVALANRDSDTVTVLLGTGTGGVGDGGFGAPVSYDVLEQPVKIVAADFNANGIIDLATANELSNNVGIMLGVGDGTFGATTYFATGTGPDKITFGDFNGNGIIDLLTTNDTTISILLGQDTAGVANGTFAAPVHYTVPSTPNETIVGDFNGDLILDVAVATASSVLVFLGNGDGTLASPIAYSSIGDLRGLVAVDFDGDGVLDIAASSASNFMAIRNAGFQDITPPTSSATGPSGSLTQASPVFDVTFTSDDTHLGSTGVDSVELFYQRDGGGFLSYGTFTTSPISFDTSTTGGDGTYEFYTVATDLAGNTETKSPTNEITVTFSTMTTVEDWSVLQD